MKSKSCGWRIARGGMGRRSYGRCGSYVGSRWRRGQGRLKDESTAGVSSYMDYVANAASFEAFSRQEPDPLLSVESLPENSSLINFTNFAQDYPEKFFSLLSHLRPEFQELAIEYYVLHKSQSFIAKCHGFIQTRTWQNLRIIEQTIGSFIILGPNPDRLILQPIIEKAGLEKTPFGSLTNLILLYATSHDYSHVAQTVKAPVPAIRKVFRPAIASLLKNKDVQAVAVGAYLRNLTHHASLTGAGLSKRYQARIRRMKTHRFIAPPSGDSPLISFGNTAMLHDAPWMMLEISSDHRMIQVYPMLKTQGKRIFGKKATQIFAPINPEGELTFGYFFARSIAPKLIRALTRIRGVSEIAAIRTDEGVFVRAVTVPDGDVQTIIEKHTPPKKQGVRVGDFVEILTGPAAGYHGMVIKRSKTKVIVQVRFPTDRQFFVSADPTSVVRKDVLPAQQAFWGVRV